MFRKIRENISYFVCKILGVKDCFEFTISAKDLGVSKEEYEEMCIQNAIIYDEIMSDISNQVNTTI